MQKGSERVLAGLVGLNVALQVFDGVATYAGLRAGIAEGNPLLAASMHWLGITPALVIFIGVIGGTLAHGIVGLFIGPIILAVAWELLTAWVRDDEVRVVPSDAESDARDISAVVGEA